MLPSMRGKDLQAVIVEPHGAILKSEVPGYENYRVLPVSKPPLFYWYQGSNAKIRFDLGVVSQERGKMTARSS